MTFHFFENEFWLTEALVFELVARNLTELEIPLQIEFGMFIALQLAQQPQRFAQENCPFTVAAFLTNVIVSFPDAVLTHLRRCSPSKQPLHRPPTFLSPLPSTT